jgi:hypothetical protein
VETADGGFVVLNGASDYPGSVPCAEQIHLVN